MTRLTSRTTSTFRREIASVVAEWERGQLNRRSLLRRAAMMGFGSAAVATLVGREATGRASAAVLRAMQDDPAAGVRGGTLRVATIGEPPHLDEHQSTADIIALIGYCAYEGLFTYDEQYQAIPELVETYTVSEDGLTHTMALRQGVMFHNGEEMLSNTCRYIGTGAGRRVEWQRDAAMRFERFRGY